ncbi:MAG: hypothetical protein SH819_06485 [Cytophagales bacterium]|nr:hypothetical protein [Cytophagales bacterium]
MKALIKQISWLVFFSIAMGFLEAAVVIYLRAIYYPMGFDFPLSVMDPTLAVTELGRELATLIVLAGVAYLAGRSLAMRFAFFLTAFAVWDIFYYIFLKLLIGWPESLLTWDILFLLPVPWVGPVLAPCLISLTMLLLASAIIHRELSTKQAVRIGWEAVLILGGSLVVFLSWTWDYFSQGYPLIGVEKSIRFFTTYIPETYRWWWFGLSEGMLLVAIWIYFMKTQRTRKHPDQIPAAR